LRWREGTTLPPASLRFDSPYDVDAHYCIKRDTACSGYRLHLTETCDTERPHVVTHVTTTIAPVQDGQVLEGIHTDLAGCHLAPGEHVVDAAYISPARIERAQRLHSITLLGPVVPDHSHQAQAGAGFDKAAFTVDWEAGQVRCPQGSLSRRQDPLRIKGCAYIQFTFDTATCLACPVRAQCTTSPAQPRAVTLLPPPLHEIQMRARAEQATVEWQRRYAIRAGIESTISQNVRTCGLRRSRYQGLGKTHVQHVLTAMACNIARVADWIASPAKVRRRASRLHTLCTALFPAPA
jgi:Transposase DDE domain